MEQGCPHCSILPHIFPDCNSLAIKIGGKFCGVRGVPRWGGLPRRCRRGGRQAGVSGARRGACPLCRLLTLPLDFFSAPIPPAPFPGGEGGDFLFSYARGFAPCIPGAEPGRHWFALPLWKTQWGGACPSVVGAAGVSGTQRGACRFWSPANPAFRFLFCPYPPSPLPGGKGVTIGYFMQGATPLASPGLNPGGTGSPCRCGKLNGGRACFVACLPCHCGARGGRARFVAC